jgi:hypothetical protein
MLEGHNVEIQTQLQTQMADERDERERTSCGTHETSLAANSSCLVWVPPRLACVISHEFSEPGTRLTSKPDKTSQNETDL